MAGIDRLVFAADRSIYAVADYKYRPPAGKSCSPSQQSLCENLYLQAWRTCLVGASSRGDYTICAGILDLKNLCVREFGCGPGETCHPDVNGGWIGPDRHGTCCPTGTTVSETFACNGQCLACSGGKVPDRACISCQCPPPEVECAGECRDNMTVLPGDAWQMWRAQNPTTPKFTCQNGQWVCDPSLVTVTNSQGMTGCCPPGSNRVCGTTCVNTLSDPANCGSCGIGCTAPLTCVNGGCSCPPGKHRCGFPSICCEMGEDCLLCTQGMTQFPVCHTPGSPNPCP